MLLRTLLPAASLVLLNAGADRLAFAPDPGIRLTKRFRVAVASELDDLSILVGGMDMTERFGAFELSLGLETRVEVTDAYVECADGRPLMLRRTYDEIAFEAQYDAVSELGSSEESATAESDLEGETVLFTWDPADGEYAVEFDAHEGDEALLEGLGEDMDLRALLPPREVAVDDEWKVEPKRLAPVLAPGGSLGLLAGDVDAEVEEMLETVSGARLAGVLDSLFSGEVVCTYKGTRDTDEGEVATIEVTIEIDSRADLSALLIELVESRADDVPNDLSLSTADLGLSLEGTALLEWNVSGGHLEHFESNVDTGIAFHLVAGAEGQSADVRAELSGHVEIGADVVR